MWSWSPSSHAAGGTVSTLPRQHPPLRGRNLGPGPERVESPLSLLREPETPPGVRSSACPSHTSVVRRGSVLEALPFEGEGCHRVKVVDIHRTLDRRAGLATPSL